jgi:hypothetical protein
LILFLKQNDRARETSPFKGDLETEIHRCLHEAFTQAYASRAGSAPSTRAAALVFSQTVMRFFMVGASYANPAYLDDEVQRAESTVAWSEDCDKRQREELTERMRAVRAAKVAKNAQGSAADVMLGGMATISARAKSIEGASSSGHTLQ